MSRAVLADLQSHRLEKPALFNPHPMYESFGPAVSKAEALEKLGLPPGKYLLFFGFIRQYKGLDILLKAMANETLREMGVKLIIAGEFYEDSKPYMDIIKAERLEDMVIQHTKFIPDSEVRYYFSACDMVVQTYKHATQSGVTQVAYYYDRPMLVTDVGGLAELVPDQKGGYVCPVDVSEISQRLVDFYRHDREEAFSAAVRVEKQRFSWESMINSLSQVAEM